MGTVKAVVLVFLSALVVIAVWGATAGAIPIESPDPFESSEPMDAGPYDDLYILRASDQVLWPSGNWYFDIISIQAHPLTVTTSNTAARALSGRATATSGTTEGVRGWADSTAGTGVYGYATADSGWTYGVHGQSASPDGRGVYGEATAATGSASGVWGQSAGSAGRGGSVCGVIQTSIRRLPSFGAPLDFLRAGLIQHNGLYDAMSPVEA